MELKKISLITLVIMVSGMLFSCNDDDDEPEKMDVAKNIVGEWLLASSSDSEWITYEFTEAARLNVVYYEDNRLQSGKGFFWTDNDKASVTGNYENESGRTTYIDWIVDEIKPFELGINLYNNNLYIGHTSLYRILSTESVELNALEQINFKSICGTDNVSDLNILDSSIASVTSAGEIKAVKVGETYLTFRTPGGHAAIKIVASPGKHSFAELMTGTWIYDKPSDKEWQRTTFIENGYVNVEWANAYAYETIETASGYYTLSDQDCSFTITTPYGTQYNQKWETENISDFIWTYQCFANNSSVGEYTAQKLLGTVTLNLGESIIPEYSKLTSGYEIQGYSAHNTSVATVDRAGRITPVGYGRTYIDVITSAGAGVFEVYVQQPAIPYDLAACLGKDAATVKGILGKNPYLATSTMIAYFDPMATISMIVASMDEATGLCKGVAISYNDNVDVDAVTSQLERDYIPFTSQTTDTFKAYMDSANRNDATVGVTWDITKLTLTFVNLGR